MKGRPFLITLIVLIITLTGFFYYYSRATAAIAAANATAAYLNNQLSARQGQLSVAGTQVASLQSQLAARDYQLSVARSQLSAAGSEVSALKSELASYQSRVSALQGEMAAGQSRITSLQAEIAAGKDQVSRLQDQLAAAGAADITALQARVSSLEIQNRELTEIVNLKKVAVKADFLGIEQQAGHPFSILPFTVDYAGYIVIGGQSSTPDAYITLINDFPGYPYNEYRYHLGTGATLTIPVLPGTVTVQYHNANPNAPSTGVISIRYYY